MKQIYRIKITILILVYVLFNSYVSKSQCLIAATVTNNCQWGDMIEAYTLNGIASGPQNNWCGLNGYNTFASPVWTLTSGGTYTFSAIAGLSAGYNEGFAIWIDLNGDNQFSGSEMLYSAAIPAMTHSGSISLAGATPGPKKMRIMCSYITVITGTQACTSDVGSFGEIEDWNVYIQSCPVIAPSLTVTASSPSVCAGSTATLTGAGANSYTWQPGNLTGSIIAVNPTVTTNYTLSGSINGCTIVPVPAQITITVSPNPTPTLTVTGNTIICAGQSTTLTVSGASTYTWSNAIVNASVNVTPSVSTVYSVTGTSSVGCTATTSKSVTVNPSPTISIAGGTSSICAGAVVTLTASGASSYTWSNGALTSTTAPTPTASTSYTVIGSNGTCTSTAVKNITVTPSPTVSVTGNTLICGTGTNILTASGANSYSWSTGALTASISASPSVTTIYTVIGTSTLSNCANTKTVSLIVSTNPTTSVTGSLVICNGQIANLSASGASTYSWSNGAATATVALSPTATTAYTVIGTNTAGCTGSNILTVTVNPSPTLSVAGDATICPGGETATLTASGANTYSWSNGATTSSIVVSPTITTTYTAIGTSSVNGCSALNTAVVTVDPCTVINNQAFSSGNLSVYPNPGNGEFMIELKNGLTKIIEITDYTGKTVLNKSTSKDVFNVNISALPDGIYLVKIESNNEMKTVKMVKQ